MSMPSSAHVRRRVSWSVFVLACLSYALLARADDGLRGSHSAAPPDAPLPFARHRVFGIDLRQMTSLQARDWLVSAGSEPLALVAIPLDGEVVSALTQESERARALAAIDTLIAAAGGSPIAACLHRPPAAVSGLGIAQTVVTTLIERYSSQITYLAACDIARDRDWQRSIVTTAAPELVGTEGLVPVSAGAALREVELDGVGSLTARELPASGAGGYALLVVDISQPIDAQAVDRAEEALGRSASSALVLLRPAPDLDPSTVVAALQGAKIAGATLPEGFSSVTGPGVALSEGWQPSTVGTVAYLRATGPGTSMVLDIVGTEVYLIGVLSPDGGEIAVWIDPDPADPAVAPDGYVLLVADQARDAAIPIATSMSAARHRIVLQTVGTETSSVTLSGIFVAGRGTTSWTSLLAALGLIGIAAGALGERSVAGITAIRASVGADQQGHMHGHPRGFVRRR